MDETARLILMEDSSGGFEKFVKAMRVYHEGISLMDCKALYSKYMGWDNRIQASHSIDTGERIR